MLICWGERDFVFDTDFLAQWRTRFPEAIVHTFPAAGHYVLEDAGDAIGPLVHEFLDAHPLRVSPSNPLSNPPAAPRSAPPDTVP